MWNLMQLLWHDEVGSSQSTEMALVTGVTVGALVVGMRSFGNAVSNRFEKVQVQDNSMQQIESQMEQERQRKEQTEEQRLLEMRQRRQQQLERRKQKAETVAATE